MGLFGAIGRAVFGGKSKNSPQKDTSKPFHTHSSDDKNSNSGGANMGPKGGDSRFDEGLGDKNDSFMGKNQVGQFSSLIDTSSVSRGGQTIQSGQLRGQTEQIVDPGMQTSRNPIPQQALDPTSQAPSVNPPRSEPTNNYGMDDSFGKNFIQDEK